MAQVTDPIMLDSTGQDIKDQISALNTKIQTLNTLLADLGLVSITPISQEDYDALSQAEKLAGVFDIYDAAEPNIDGNKVSYDNTDSELDATNTQAAIDELSGKAIYTFTPDGTTTISAALNALYAEGILDDHSFIFAGTTCFYLSEVGSGNFFFSSTVCSGNALITHTLFITTSNSKLYRSTTNTSGTTFTDLSSSTNIGFTVYKRY